MKKFDVRTTYATYSNCFFIVKKYLADKSLAISIWNMEDGPIADLTVCLGSAGDNKSYLDVNNSPWAIDLVAKLGIATFTGEVCQSGYVVYPLYEFDVEKLKEYSKEEEL